MVKHNFWRACATRGASNGHFWALFAGVWSTLASLAPPSGHSEAARAHTRGTARVLMHFSSILAPQGDPGKKSAAGARTLVAVWENTILAPKMCVLPRF